MTTKRLKNFISDMSRTNTNMLGVADTEIDVANIQTIRSKNAEVVSGNKITRRGVSGDYPNKTQSDLTEKQIVRWRWKLFSNCGYGHQSNL